MFGFVKTFEKSTNNKNNKDNQNNFRENPQQTKFLKVSDPPLDMFCLFGFPEGFYKTK